MHIVWSGEDLVQSRIRIARGPSDARGIAQVHVDSWQATYGNGLLPRRYLDRLTVPGLTQRWQRRLSRGFSGYTVWVAEDNGGVVGFAEIGPCLQDDALLGFAGELYMLYVHPSHTGQGIGQALLKSALESLEDRPFFWAVAWVVEGNHLARTFYRRAGLRPDGDRRTDRFADRQVPVLRYARPLNPAVDFNRLFDGE